MIGQILGSLGGLATSYIDGKTAVKKAEAETKMKIATGEISWEQAAIEASRDSWKDEAWTLCFIAIVLGASYLGYSPTWSRALRTWRLHHRGLAGPCMLRLLHRLESVQ